MTRKKKVTTATPSQTQAATISPSTIFNNITLPQPSSENKEPKIKTVDVGPFRLPGVKVDLNQFDQDQAQELMDFARETGAYIREDGLLSWKSASRRDWFILRWS